jgi:hypothetical protein
MVHLEFPRVITTLEGIFKVCKLTRIDLGYFYEVVYEHKDRLLQNMCRYAIPLPLIES